ncbi:class I SAM-dependent methyltransferase [Lentzea tibetensis]|uniref:Class I SAM-dependent methyltransferase n=1 Tax=Lentzea tibetensis TaxID=2591470 RepID=A0A563EVB4_9PSEU|nr:class I SAM-dependent methyltransferase [Lentzea tibetensis]TWP51593.1 class I SAM-dependent methyltransferase [Lentzea tibetensis]
MGDTKRADFYDGPAHDYLRYWDGRDYEHAAERIALERLLTGEHFAHAVDVGGGYGRLSVLLHRYADRVTLAEPSRRQLDIAADVHPELETVQAQAADLPFADGSVDLVTMIRVMHHLPDPTAELAEIARVLDPVGAAVVEVANLGHFRNRLRHLGRGIPSEPVDIRSPENRHDDEIPFVNHNLDTVTRQLNDAGLRVERVLSVSNFRSATLKRVVPHRVLVRMEEMAQVWLASLRFGPSIFLLLRKR